MSTLLPRGTLLWHTAPFLPAGTRSMEASACVHTNKDLAEGGGYSRALTPLVKTITIFELTTQPLNMSTFTDRDIFAARRPWSVGDNHSGCRADVW